MANLLRWRKPARGSTSHAHKGPCPPCAGFEGRYTNKAGSAAEGEATFWRRSRFRAVACLDLRMKDVFAALLDDSGGPGNAAELRRRHAQFLPLLRSSPSLVHALQKVRGCECNEARLETTQRAHFGALGALGLKAGAPVQHSFSGEADRRSSPARRSKGFLHDPPFIQRGDARATATA